MKTYHWKEYGFIGTVPDFARHLGVCKVRLLSMRCGEFPDTYITV